MPEEYHSLLIIEKGPDAGAEIPLTSARSVIGRSVEANVQIEFTAVSREHAVIIRKEDCFEIEDLGSSNGTTVNGEPVDNPVRLNFGDKIGIGQAILLRFIAPKSDSAMQKPDHDFAETSVRKADTGGNVLETKEPPRFGRILSDSDQELQTRIADSSLVDRLAATTIGEEPVELSDVSEPPSLTVKIAGEIAHRYILSADAVSVGRDSTNDLVIDSQIVSRHHFSLIREEFGFRVNVSSSASNPLLLDGQVVEGEQRLSHGDILRIGGRDPGSMVTMEYDSPAEQAGTEPTSIKFEGKTDIQLGRDPSNDVVIDAPMVSRFHASIERVGKRFRLRDLGSTNGTFVNGEPVSGERWLTEADTVRIGPYRYVVMEGSIAQYDDSHDIRVEVRGLHKWVRSDLNILKDISLAIQPREFVVVVGQSGGGKSTLVDAIAGYRPATHGQVLVNGVDVYKNFDAIRNIIGYVPQKDIIHAELTVYEALDYAARLRMPADTSAHERHERIEQVLEDLDLAHRRSVQVSGLSGGQQKRVSIGVELLTKPGLFFLDEPSSGLDPGTETALMHLMRRLADQGRTIVLITHATKNVLLADKVAFLARGGYLAWFGPPDAALEYFNHYRTERERKLRPMEFDDIYTLLADEAKGTPQEWGQRYQQHPAYLQNVVQPLTESDDAISLASAAKQAVPNVVHKARKQVSSLRQFLILSARNIRILVRDRFSLALMLASAPLVGLLDVILSLVLGRQPFGFTDGHIGEVLITMFLLAVYGVMVGGLSQMREIVKEGEIYRRERLVNLKVLPYVLSKVWLAALFAMYQAAAYTIIHYIAFDMPGGVVEFVLIYITLAIATMAGMMIGLFASSLAPSANAAPMLVILFMLPQIVLGGALVPLPPLITSVTSTGWAFRGLMGATGAGSDVAADICFQLPVDQRVAMTLEAKEENGCRCLGPNVLRQEACDFPGSGFFYTPAIDQPPPEEPPPAPERPLDPVMPEPPPEPEDQSDAVAVAEYLERLEAYQEQVENIQREAEAEFAEYEANLEIYQAQITSYQQSRIEWQISREAAIQPVEGMINASYRDFGWTFVDKQDPLAFAFFMTTSWGAQVLIIGLLLAGTLVMVKRKDIA